MTAGADASYADLAREIAQLRADNQRMKGVLADRAVRRKLNFHANSNGEVKSKMQRTKAPSFEQAPQNDQLKVPLPTNRAKLYLDTLATASITGKHDKPYAHDFKQLPDQEQKTLYGVTWKGTRENH